MDRLAEAAGGEQWTALLTADATVENLTSEIRRAAQALTSGDFFLFTCSRHGGQVPVHVRWTAPSGELEAVQERAGRT
ncbi:hypothetical protein [Streptomyces sp. M2CJ-2]|uniref:hypothetical protein n=1 Tax=Streptomyces sp. M2CJ-2 TaxID=2803948 RepID=UPI0027DB68F2|nr:hypothetical protein [Streptomyces sp. M2CJ-2]